MLDLRALNCTLELLRFHFISDKRSLEVFIFQHLLLCVETACSVPVLVGLNVPGAGVGIVEAGDVEHLELLVLQRAHRLHRILLLREVDVVALESKSANERVKI